MEKILSCFASTRYGIFTCVSMYWHYWILYKENISIFELISESWQVFRENILVTFFLPTSLCEYYFSPYGFYRIIWIILFICLYLKFISSKRLERLLYPKNETIKIRGFLEIKSMTLYFWKRELCDCRLIKYL